MSRDDWRPLATRLHARGRRACAFRLGLCAAMMQAWVFSACSGDPAPSEGGSETHFLAPCEDTCPGDTECVCGVCTLRCSTDRPCTRAASASSCVTSAPRIATGRCSAQAPPAFCDALCLANDDCAALGQDYRCRGGYCRAETSATPAEGGLNVAEASAASEIGTAEASTSAPCVPTGIASQDLLILGDSHVNLTKFTSYFEQDALDRGALTEGEHFRVHSSYMTSLLAEGSLSISGMYAAARQEGPIRVVVMDGGETDMFQPLCDSEPKRTCPTVQAAVRGAQNLLQQMAEDGVERVFYFFYPDPIDNTALQSNLDTLRPLIQNACGHGAVACQWIDLRPTFAGHPGYLAADGVLLSEEGAEIAAGVIWQRMQSPCVP